MIHSCYCCFYNFAIKHQWLCSDEHTHTICELMGEDAGNNASGPDLTPVKLSSKSDVSEYVSIDSS